MAASKNMGEAYRNMEQGSFGVLNFRDLGVSSAENAEKIKYIKEGLIFRSATLDNMDEEQVDAFLEMHKIRTILDLRTAHEGREGLPIDKSFPTSALETLTPAAVLMKDKKESSTEPNVSKEYETTGQGSLVRKKYKVDFAGRNFQRYCVFSSCSFRLKLYLVYLMTTCQRRKASYIVGQQVLSPMGVNKMYKEFATYCQGEMLAAMMIFADPSNYPIEVHCTQGKDRTGIVSALVMSIAGVPQDVIVNDYTKTQKGLAPVYDAMLEEVRKAGLSEDFAQAPASNMRDFLEFLTDKYGSVEGYLDTIGFGPELRDRVRQIICV